MGGLLRERSPSMSKNLAGESANSPILQDHIAKEHQVHAEQQKLGWLFLRSDKVVQCFERLRPWQSSYNRMNKAAKSESLERDGLNQKTRSAPLEGNETSRPSVS